MKRHWLFTWRGITKSITVRFALMVFLLQLLAAVATGFYAERMMWEQFRRYEQVPVLRLRDSLVAEYHVNGLEGLTMFIHERIKNNYTKDIAILLAAPDDRIVAGNLPQWPSNISDNTTWSVSSVRAQGIDHYQHMGLMVVRLKDNYRLLVGTAIISEAYIFPVYVSSALLCAFLAILISILIVWLASWMIGRRLGHVAHIANNLVAGDFSGRLEISGSGDRLEDLMRWINRMLDRLESLVDELQIVGDGLAHDLRSPITRLRVTLERALTETDDPKTLAAMNKIMVETDTLLAMLAATLQISNAEAGTSRERFTETDVSLMLKDLAEIYGPLAEEKGFSITADCSVGLTALLHRDLVSQALSNLIENALNYATGGTKIILGAVRSANDLDINVADNGIGIPMHRYEDAKRRYGRLDPARQVPGSGLGLSLVDAVARLHKGQLILADHAPGLLAMITFPVDRP
jgi:signal transduction histidine kinase